MRTRETRLARRIVPALAFGWFALILFGMAGLALLHDHRMATNPHVMGRIERTWVRYGKGGGRYADVMFPSTNDGGAIRCEAKGLRIGRPRDPGAIGDAVDLVPIPGAGCARPEIGRDASPAVLLLFVLGLGLVFTFVALKVFMGAQAPRHASRS